MKRCISSALAAVAALQLALAPTTAALAAAPQLDAGSRIYLSLDEGITSARGDADVGQVLRCRVWRDVEDRGVIFVRAGTPATCRVDKVKRRNMGGFEGKVSIAAVETRAVDGSLVMLSGGYNKEGSGHKAVVWTVGLLLLWPVLFVPGGNAELPPGTVIDGSIVNPIRLAETEAPAPRRVNLSSLNPGLTAEFMLDDFIDQPKHDTFRIKVAKDGGLPQTLVIDNVNGKPVEALPLKLTKVTPDGTGVAEIGAKTLAKHFARGINRFEVAYTDGGDRRATEVVMDVQM